MRNNKLDNKKNHNFCNISQDIQDYNFVKENLIDTIKNDNKIKKSRIKDNLDFFERNIFSLEDFKKLFFIFLLLSSNNLINLSLINIDLIKNKNNSKVFNSNNIKYNDETENKNISKKNSENCPRYFNQILNKNLNDIQIKQELTDINLTEYSTKNFNKFDSFYNDKILLQISNMQKIIEENFIQFNKHLAILNYQTNSYFNTIQKQIPKLINIEKNIIIDNRDNIIDSDFIDNISLFQTKNEKFKEQNKNKI